VKSQKANLAIFNPSSLLEARKAKTEDIIFGKIVMEQFICQERTGKNTGN